MALLKNPKITDFALILAGCLTFAVGILMANDPQKAKSPEVPTAQTAKPVNPEIYQPERPIPTDEELKAKLTPIQYKVVRENGTERPFTNEYWTHKEEGIYVDIVSGTPLFSSKDKFDTDCGWPAFSKPLMDEEVKEFKDLSHGMTRVEVRSKTADSHLGHVFTDGPKEHGGLRYCINSAAIRFIPKAKMQELGYGKWLKLFENEEKK